MYSILHKPKMASKHGKRGKKDKKVPTVDELLKRMGSVRK